MNWIDDKDRKTKEIIGSDLRTKSLRIAIHHQMGSPGVLFGSCNGDIEIHNKRLMAIDIKAAKKEFIAILKEKIAELLQELEAF